MIECSAAVRVRIEPLLRRLPRLEGRRIRLEFRAGLADRHGAVHGGAFLRERRIALDMVLRRDRRELARIVVHELFHFTWVRLGNARRREYEALLRREVERRARGELGWSAEWRKRRLVPRDWSRRSRRWREYVAESFCDTAAWRFAGLRRHPEFTLAARFRRQRRRWLESAVTNRMPI